MGLEMKVLWSLQLFGAGLALASAVVIAIYARSSAFSIALASFTLLSAVVLVLAAVTQFIHLGRNEGAIKGRAVW